MEVLVMLKTLKVSKLF